MLTDTPAETDREIAVVLSGLLKAVLHGWRICLLHRLAENTQLLAEAAKSKSVTASAANDEYRSKVGESMHLQLQQKKAACGSAGRTRARMWTGT